MEHQEHQEHQQQRRPQVRQSTAPWLGLDALMAQHSELGWQLAMRSWLIPPQPQRMLVAHTNNLCAGPHCVNHFCHPHQATSETGLHPAAAAAAATTLHHHHQLL